MHPQIIIDGGCQAVLPARQPFTHRNNDEDAASLKEEMEIPKGVIKHHKNRTTKRTADHAQLPTTTWTRETHGWTVHELGGNFYVA
jgi:hypothetical protein